MIFRVGTVCVRTSGGVILYYQLNHYYILRSHSYSASIASRSRPLLQRTTAVLGCEHRKHSLSFTNACVLPHLEKPVSCDSDNGTSVNAKQE